MQSCWGSRHAFNPRNPPIVKSVVVVNVRDHQGTLILGLKPAALNATVDGHAATVSSATLGTVHRIVVLLDVSGSVTYVPAKWYLARFASEDVIASSPVTTQVALVVFAGDVAETQDFSHSRVELLQRITQRDDPKKLGPKYTGRTTLRDAVLHATDLFGHPSMGDAVYVVSDGVDNNSRIGWSALERMLLGKGIRLFGFVLPGYPFRDREEKWSLDSFGDLTRVTGGGLLNSGGNPSPGKDDWKEASKQMFDQMAHFYSVELNLPASLDKERKLDLEVVDDKGKRLKDLQLSFPRKLAPCPPPVAPKTSPSH